MKYIKIQETYNNQQKQGTNINFKGKKINIDQIIDYIADFKDENNYYLIKKFSLNYLVQLLDREKLNQIQNLFNEYDKKGIDIIDFTRIFLNSIDHNQAETLYLTIAIIQLFKAVSESIGMQTHIKMCDLTNFICDEYVGTLDLLNLPTKKLPPLKHYPKQIEQQIRLIDIKAPIIYGQSNNKLRRLVENKVITDSCHHTNYLIKKCNYSIDTKRLFSLDSLTDRINIFSLDCTIEQTIIPNINIAAQKKIIIMNIAWSERQQRLGATTKDLNLLFWDSFDGFRYQKTIFIQNFVSQYQSNIWFINSLNQWLTTDSTNILYSWDLITERINYKLTKIRGTIIDLVEIPYMKLIAIPSLDKVISIYNLEKQILILTIDCSIGGIHSLVFSQTYQVLAAAGYENQISIYTIDPIFLDHSLITKLIGHNSMISAIQVIEKTPMLVSIDDNGFIKIWDIRDFKCKQTIKIGCKGTISHIIDIANSDKLCLIGSRINFIQWDEPLDFIRNKPDYQYPIKVEINYEKNELAVATRKDIRFINLKNGRTKKIFQNLFQKDDESEITIFQVVEQNKKFILGSHKGQIELFNYTNGEHLENLKSHNGEISSFKIDNQNQLYLSSGEDSKLMIQQQNDKKEFEYKRILFNCFNNKEISLMEVSIYHNLIIMSSTSNEIIFWDYENWKYLGMVQLKPGQETTTLSVINGYGIVAIGTNFNIIYFLQVKSNDNSVICKLIGIINLDLQYKIQLLQEDKKDQQEIKTAKKNKEESDPIIIKHEKNKLENMPHKLILDISYNDTQTNEFGHINKCNIFISLMKGHIRCYSLMELFKKFQIQIQPPSKDRVNYNPFKASNEYYEQALNKSLGEVFIITKKKEQEYGVIEFDKGISLSFRAHKEQLNSFSLIQLKSQLLITSSLDYYIRIWNMQGEMIASLNINHPLPIIWNIGNEIGQQFKRNILFALKIIELLFRRYKQDIMLVEEQKLNINDFLGSVLEQFQKSDEEQKCQNSLQKVKCRKNELKQVDEDSIQCQIKKEKKKMKEIILMKDEYEPRDIQYEKVKEIFFPEMRGPILQKIDANKRVQQAYLQSRKANMVGPYYFGNTDFIQQKINDLEEKRKDFQNMQIKEKDPIQYFDPEYKTKLLRGKIELDDQKSDTFYKFASSIQLLIDQMNQNFKRKIIRKDAIQNERIKEISEKYFDFRQKQINQKSYNQEQKLQSPEKQVQFQQQDTQKKGVSSQSNIKIAKHESFPKFLNISSITPLQKSQSLLSDIKTDFQEYAMQKKYLFPQNITSSNHFSQDYSIKYKLKNALSTTSKGKKVQFEGKQSKIETTDSLENLLKEENSQQKEEIQTNNQYKSNKLRKNFSEILHNIDLKLKKQKNNEQKKFKLVRFNSFTRNNSNSIYENKYFFFPPKQNELKDNIKIEKNSLKPNKSQIENYVLKKANDSKYGIQQLKSLNWTMEELLEDVVDKARIQGDIRIKDNQYQALIKKQQQKSQLKNILNSNITN